MADKNDFDFEEESEETGPEKDEGRFDFDEPLPEDGTETAGEKKSSTPMLLLLLLLVAIGAGAYYYFFMQPPSAPPVTAKVVKKQPIAVPARTTEPKAKPAQPAKEASEKRAAEQMADGAKVAAADTGKTQVDAEVKNPAAAKEAPQVKEAAAEPTAEAKTVATAPVEKGDAPVAAESVKKSDAPVGKTIEAAPVATEKATEDSATATPVAATANSEARYTIQAGAYTRNASLERAKKMVQDLGYAPQVSEVQRQVEMIRLRLGAFYPDEGREKLQEILPLAPDAFAVQKGELMVIYAASFQDKKLADRFTASLKEKGLHVDAERNPVELKMMLINFGAFADKAKAEEAAKAAQKAGLETMITAIAR